MAIENINPEKAREEIRKFEKSNTSIHGPLELVTCWNEEDPDFVQYRFFKTGTAIKISGITRMEEPDDENT